MKRLHKKQHDNLYRAWPLFCWRKCSNCRQEFRREWGWRVIDGPWVPNGTEYYICGDCAPTRDMAHEIALSKPWMPRWPVAPKPPNTSVQEWVSRDDNFDGPHPGFVASWPTIAEVVGLDGDDLDEWLRDNAEWVGRGGYYVSEHTGEK